MEKLIFRTGIFACLLVMVSLNTSATLVTGCVIYEGTGAPRLSAGIYPGATTSFDICNGYLVRIYTVGGSSGPLNALCYTPSLPNAGPALFRNCTVGGNCGIVRTIDIVMCPIDDYASYMILPLAVAGIFFIRKKK